MAAKNPLQELEKKQKGLGARPEYSPSGELKAEKAALKKTEGMKPEDYQSGYEKQINALMDQALNRESFRYDAAADPLYRQYAEQYQRKGQLAMRDNMAQAAALTGGYGNSYASQAGQMGYQQYLEKMNEIFPQLVDAAYGRYQDEGDQLERQLAMLRSADDIDYGRYKDRVKNWQGDRDYAYGKYDDLQNAEMKQYQNQSDAWESDRDFLYKAMLDGVIPMSGGASASGGGSGRSGRSGGSSGGSAKRGEIGKVSASEKKGGDLRVTASEKKGVGLMPETPEEAAVPAAMDPVEELRRLSPEALALASMGAMGNRGADASGKTKRMGGKTAAEIALEMLMNN